MYWPIYTCVVYDTSNLHFSWPKTSKLWKCFSFWGTSSRRPPYQGSDPGHHFRPPDHCLFLLYPQPLWAGDATGQKHGPFQSSSPWGGQHPSRNPLAASSVSSLTPSHFLPRDATRKRCLCCLPVSVRPSVRLSRLCIVSRRLKISSNLFIGPVAPSF